MNTKIKLSILLCAIHWYSASGQNNKITTYRGAFEPAPQSAWTDGWTNFEPKTFVYPSSTDTIGEITLQENTVWSNNKVYCLRGRVFIKENVTLSIEPGTIIRAVEGTAIIVLKGGKIVAKGTRNMPIVFTSAIDGDYRYAGNWGGIIICGNASHNISLGPNTPIPGNIPAYFGGSNDNDSSGVLSYVRIEFAGESQQSQGSYLAAPLSLYGVGKNTVIDHIQVSYSNYDSFRLIGGTVNLSHLVSFRTKDDDFDVESGFRGSIQFGVAHRDPVVADQSLSNGIEVDNDPQGSSVTPLTNVAFRNMTIIGPTYMGAAVANANYRRAVHFRRNSSGEISNSILIGFPEAGLYLEGKKTVANAVNGDFIFNNNFLANNTLNIKLAPPSTHPSSGITTSSDTLGINTSADLESFLSISSKGNVFGTASEDAMLIAPFNFTDPDYRPVAGSQLLPLEKNNDLASNQILVFPNPATKNVEIVSTDTQINGTILILNSNGLIMASMPVTQNVFKFDVSELADGLYVICINSGGKIINKKLLIRN